MIPQQLLYKNSMNCPEFTCMLGIFVKKCSKLSFAPNFQVGDILAFFSQQSYSKSWTALIPYTYLLFRYPIVLNYSCTSDLYKNMSNAVLWEFTTTISQMLSKHLMNLMGCVYFSVYLVKLQGPSLPGLIKGVGVFVGKMRSNYPQIFTLSTSTLSNKSYIKLTFIIGVRGFIWENIRSGIIHTKFSKLSFCT